MKTTITEEYEDGQLVRRTTVTEGEHATGGWVQSDAIPFPGLYPTRCSCGPWHGVTPPPRCPVHGQALAPSITVSTSTTNTPGEIAAEVGRQLRGMG